jgi:Fe-S cluster biogenesis protein NfuA
MSQTYAKYYISVVTMKEKIEKVIDEQIRPGLQMDGGDIELVDVGDDGVVKVRLTGACGGCPMSQLTLTMGVERILKEMIPEVKGVVAVP